VTDISVRRRHEACPGAALTPKRERFFGRSRHGGRFMPVLADISPLDVDTTYAFDIKVPHDPQSYPSH